MSGTENLKCDVAGFIGARQNEVVSCYWVVTQPFFQAVLYVLPSTDEPTTIIVSDVDGNLINQAVLNFPAGKVNKIELEMLLGRLKQDSGFKHAVVILKSPAGTKHFCSLSSLEDVIPLGKMQLFTGYYTTFMPISFADNIAYYVALANLGKVDASARCRLLVGNKTNDLEVPLPSSGLSVFSVKSKFSDFVEVAEGERKMAYLRFSTRSDEPFGVHVLGRFRINDKDEFVSLC